MASDIGEGSEKVVVDVSNGLLPGEYGVFLTITSKDDLVDTDSKQVVIQDTDLVDNNRFSINSTC